MGERRKVTRPKRLVEKYGENFPIWSFSRINTLENCVHEYWLSRIKKVESKDNVYTMLGTYSHDILEDYYNDKIEHSSMSPRFESDFIDVEISDFKFSNDEDRNDSMRKKYKECVTHFFKHHDKMADKVATEKLIWIDVSGNVFMGYVDAINKDKDGNVIITDFKTSSLYKGAKIQQQAKQLLLYALGLHQGGVPLEKIKIRWLFLKYLSISYKLKNGKTKVTQADRNSWVKAIKTPLKKDIIAIHELEEWEADLTLEECISNNSLNILHEDIRNKYTISDCYVYPEISEEILEDLKREFSSAVKDIENRGIEESNWEREPIQPKDEYYCYSLCGVKGSCKYFKEHIDNKNGKQKEEEDLISILDNIELPF
jgi:hypothetical protein